MRVGFAVVDDILTPEECSIIIEHGVKNLKKSEIIDDNLGDVRKGRTSFFEPGCDISELLSKVVRTFSHFSEQIFGSEAIITDVEIIQFTEYKPGDFYNWHYDQHGLGYDGDIPERVMSCSVELCDPKEYEGGGVEFFGLNEEIAESMLGRMIIFPSTMAHRARKVTKGTRYSLVLWGHRQ